jgi:hypothetical protein
MRLVPTGSAKLMGGCDVYPVRAGMTRPTGAYL